MIAIALNGIAFRLFATPGARLPEDQLGVQLQEAVNNELLADIESEKLQAIRIDDAPASQRKEKKVKIKIVDGVVIFESLPFGLTRKWGIAITKIEEGRILQPRRRFIQDFVHWEESLDFVWIVPEALLVIDKTCVLPRPGRSILKPFDSGRDVATLPKSSFNLALDGLLIPFNQCCLANEIRKEIHNVYLFATPYQILCGLLVME